MKQILHIFRKDARHRWIEIVASLALLALYAWRESKSWGPTRHTFPELLHFLWGLTVPLVPIAWCFLIVRVVHDENLVGDRQFWVTRPYEWKKLLAAKLLFVAVFINLPMLVVDVVLLAKAGFRPRDHLLGLLWMQLLLTLFMTLPAAAAAAITSSTAQVLILVLLVVMYMIGVASLGSIVPDSGVWAAQSVPGALGLAVLITACVAAVTWQYARRQTWKARGLLIIASVVIVILVVVTPYRMLVERAYPAIASGHPEPVVLSLGPTAEHAAKKHESPNEGTQVELIIPLRPTGIAKDSVVGVDGTQFVITAADGTRWSSGWQGGGGSYFWPDRGNGYATVDVPTRFFDRAKAGASRVDVSFALSTYREEDFRSLEVPRGEFRAPGVGICAPTLWGFTAALQCRSAMKSPAVIASINTSAQTCPSTPDKPAPPPGIRITEELWSESSGLEELGISPVRTFSLGFWNWADPNDKFSSAGACPGTSVTFSTPVLTQQVRTKVEFQGLRLEDYAHWNDASGGEVGFDFVFTR